MVDAQGQSGNPEAVVDWRTARRSIPGGIETLRHVVALLMEDGPRLLERLRRALASGDAEEARLSVHTLRVHAAYFGARAVGEHAAAIEKLAAAGDLGRVPAALPDLERAVEALVAALGEAEDLDEEAAT